MKLCRFAPAAGGAAAWGLIEAECVVELGSDPFSGEAIEAGSGKRRELATVRLLAPCRPSKIVAIGLNYKAHAAEFGKPLPEEPMLFMKPSTSVIGPGESIIYPSHMSHRVDYEGELAVVVGTEARQVQVRDAARHILGYTCLNDVTARDLQGKDGQYTRAKGFDTFAPIGPVISTELDPLDASVQTLLNGEIRQDTSTKDMIFNVFQLLSFVSHVMTLLPGDMIATGTPSGVGKMRPGDVVEVRIKGIGSLENTVAEGSAFRRVWADS